MKKTLIAIIAILILVFSLVGCKHKTTYTDAVDGSTFNNDDWGEGYFTIVKGWGSIDCCHYMIVYANDTKVMYFVDQAGYAGGITPLYNADGTLQIYTGE